MDHVTAYPAPIPLMREDLTEESHDSMDEDDVSTDEALSDDDDEEVDIEGSE